MSTTVDLGDRCVHCGASTAQGSGKFVNRLPTSVDFDESLHSWFTPPADAPVHLILDGWTCTECWDDECVICGAPIALDEDWPNADGHACLNCSTPATVADAYTAWGYDDDHDEVTDTIQALLQAKAEVTP